MTIEQYKKAGNIVHNIEELDALIESIKSEKHENTKIVTDNSNYFATHYLEEKQAKELLSILEKWKKEYEEELEKLK